jgi:hypothetical protein
MCVDVLGFIIRMRTGVEDSEISIAKLVLEIVDVEILETERDCERSAH